MMIFDRTAGGHREAVAVDRNRRNLRGGQCSSQPSQFYSMILSALTSRVGGILRPSAFAVFWLIHNSRVVGNSTGKSAGLAPFSILST